MTLGGPQGEILFVCLDDSSLRTFLMQATGALQQVAKFTIPFVKQLLWFGPTGQLLLHEFDDKKSSDKVSLFAVSAGGRTVEPKQTVVPPDLGMIISCLCLHKASLFCFDSTKKELSQIDM